MLIIEAESDDTVLSILLGIGFYGNIWSKTLRAFTAEEGKSIIDGVPQHSLGQKWIQIFTSFVYNQY